VAFGALEWLANSWIGIRVSGRLQPTHLSAAPQLWSGHLGVALHLLPYRSFDLSFFVEGGPGVLEPFADTRNLAPVLVGGAALDLYLNAYFFLHLEGQLAWARWQGHLWYPTVWLGLGYSF
jgi:hypothetical protein